MTVNELRAILAGTDGDLQVVLARNEEGTECEVVDYLQIGLYQPLPPSGGRFDADGQSTAEGVRFVPRTAVCLCWSEEEPVAWDAPVTSTPIEDIRRIVSNIPLYALAPATPPALSVEQRRLLHHARRVNRLVEALTDLVLTRSVDAPFTYREAAERAAKIILEEETDE